jgi:hypothetical protein
MKYFSVVLLLTVQMNPLRAQTPDALPSISPPANFGDTVKLMRDTPLELMATKEITTATAKPGMPFKVRVNKPVMQGNRIIIPVGSWAYGEVVTATDAGGLGKSGKMTARLTYLALGDAKIALDGRLDSKGTGSGSAGVAVLIVGITGLFHRGNNAKIKAGEIINAFTSEDVLLDLAAKPIRRIDPAYSASVN